MPILVKIDQEMRPWECPQTDRHTQTQTDFIICPMLCAIAMGQIKIRLIWSDILGKKQWVMVLRLYSSNHYQLHARHMYKSHRVETYYCTLCDSTWGHPSLRPVSRTGQDYAAPASWPDDARSPLCYVTHKQVRLDATPPKCITPPQKCIWFRYDLDLWPLTLKTFPAMPTHMVNIFFYFRQLSLKREIESRETRVNGRPEGRPENTAPTIVGWGIIA